MADKKISELPASTTPLAGTEVLPIVQGGATKQVSVDNLTAGKVVSALTLTADGVVTSGTDTQVGRNIQMKDAGGTGTSRVIIEYDALNDLRIKTGTTSGARSIFLQTEGIDHFKVDSSGNITALTGNLVVGTAAKGIDFSANTHAAGMTSELLNWYEEGTWTPVPTSLTTSGTMSYTGYYTRIGRMVYWSMNIVSSGGDSTATADSTTFSGLGFVINSNAGAFGTCTAVNRANTGSLGVGQVVLSGGTTTIFVPSWTSLTNVLVNGFFIV